MANNPTISSITLPSGTTYDIKDAAARSAIEALSTYSNFLGVTSSNISDGSETNPVVIGGENVTATTGDIVTKGSKEMIWNGSAWQEFGDLSALKALAYKDDAEGSYTPAGSVSQPTFTGTALTSTGTYTPEGTVGTPEFTGTAGSVSVTGTPSGSVTIAPGEGTANYTPAGSVSAPTITVTPSTDSVYSITAVGTLPELTTSVSSETLTIGFSQGTLPTKGDAQTVMTGASASATAPTFTGTGVDLEATFAGDSLSSTGSFTPAGSVSAPSFTGTQGNLSVSGTPAGTVSQPTFSGTAATITVS